MSQNPFTVYFRAAIQGQGRDVRLRYAQRIAIQIYNELIVEDSINLAQPGGGQRSGFNLHDFANYSAGLQVKPQFGEAPAQLVITGFYITDSKVEQTYGNLSFLHAGANVNGVVTGVAAQARDSKEVTAVDSEVSALSAIFQTALDTVNATWTDANVSLFRLNYKNILFGDSGIHFPR